MRGLAMLAVVSFLGSCKPACGTDGGTTCACAAPTDLCGEGSGSSSCCAGSCTNGLCCAPTGAACYLSTGSDTKPTVACCDGEACATVGGVKDAPGTCCITSGLVCQLSNQCCSGSCIFGDCL